MSKLLLSNNNSKELYLHGIFQESGFKRYNNLDCGSVYGIIYKKLNIENENFLKIGDDYIGTIGTIIYRGIIGESALFSMYKDFVAGADIRNNAIGNYILLVKQGSIIRIITDDSAIIDLYYYSIGKEWAITNTYYHLGRILDQVDENELGLIEDSFQNTIIGNNTPIHNVYRLEENEEIVIDTLSGSFSLVTHDIKKNMNYNYDSIISRLNRNGEKLAINFENFAVYMTGGLDSRIVLGSLLKNKILPTLIYGQGDSPLTNTKSEDLDIVKNISSSFNLPLQLTNWKTTIPCDESWDEYLEKYGELSAIYNGNRNIFSFFEQNKNYEYITYGYFGEFLRSIEWIDTINTDFFTLKQFVDLYFNHNIPFETKDNLYKSIYTKFYNICEVLDIDSQKLSKDNFHQLHYYYRKVADNKMCNFTNLFCYSTIILSDSIILENIINLPYSDKRNSHLALQLIKDIYPELLKYPVCSHCKKMQYDENSENLYVVNGIKVYSGIKAFLKRVPIAKNIINFILSKVRKQRNKTAELFSGFSHDSEQYGYCKLLSYHLDVRHIVKYLQYKSLINRIKSSQ